LNSAVTFPCLTRTIKTSINPESYDEASPLCQGKSTLLPAELLHDLARLDEGARARLIDSYQAQQAHRHALESQEAAANIRIRERAQRYALVIGVLGLVLAATLVLLKENATAGTVAGLIALVAIGGPVTANILARRIGKDGATGPNN
jgi:uncharacterized membrane protein